MLKPGIWATMLVLLAGPLGGCGPPVEEIGGALHEADTLPSGRILVRVGSGPETPAWGLQERARLGSVDGLGPNMFGDVRGVILDDQGRIIVLDGQAQEVRVFGGDGTYLRTLGRSGEGPGELSRPAGLALDGEGQVWVLNWGNARYTAFHPDTGELLQEQQRLASFVAFPWPGAFDADGRLVDLGLDGNAEPAILRLDSAFVPRDTLPMPQPDAAYGILIRRGETPVMMAVDPFAPSPAWAPARVGIVMGEGDAYRLHRIGFAGDTTLTVEVSAPRARVTRGERDSVLAEFQELVSSAGGTAERQPRVPDVKPAHGPLLVDDQDRIWVQWIPPAGEARGWDVIGPDGEFVARVRLPMGLDAILRSVRGDRLAVTAEVGGVPTVIVYTFAAWPG